MQGVTFLARMTGLSTLWYVDSFTMSTSNLRIRTQFSRSGYLEIQTRRHAINKTDLVWMLMYLPCVWYKLSVNPHKKRAGYKGDKKKYLVGVSLSHWLPSKLLVVEQNQVPVRCHLPPRRFVGCAGRRTSSREKKTLSHCARRRKCQAEKKVGTPKRCARVRFKGH